MSVTPDRAQSVWKGVRAWGEIISYLYGPTVGPNNVTETDGLGPFQKVSALKFLQIGRMSSNSQKKVHRSQAIGGSNPI